MLLQTLPVQLEMINQLKQNNVQYIILWSGCENVCEQGNVTDLDNFIRIHYQLSKTFGNYSIYTMKN